MLGSIVSTNMIKHMLNSLNKMGGRYAYETTLTGFKWIGNKSLDLIKNNKNKKVLFAFEEAIGKHCNK